MPQILKEKIAKLQKAIASPATPENVKKAMGSALDKLQKEMIEYDLKKFKEGELKTSAGKTVKDKKQAVAIALSESGKSKKAKKAKSPKTPKEKKPAATYKGKKLTDLDEADCEELLASIKERRAAAKKSNKKSASKPVIEKIAGNIATAVKQAVETVTATEIKKNPKKENAKMKEFAMFIKKAFETAAKKFLGSDYKQGAVNDEFKPIFDLINEITSKYE
jgi:hypothetical protein